MACLQLKCIESPDDYFKIEGDVAREVWMQINGKWCPEVRLDFKSVKELNEWTTQWLGGNK